MQLLSSVRRVVAVALCALALTAAPASAGGIVVFAAASLKNALDEAAATFTAETGTDVTLAYAGSSALARQIEAGAPADVFISANVAWMDWLAARERIVHASRRDLLGNRLVLIAVGRGSPQIALEPGATLDTRLDEGRIAMALVDAVPAGIYGKAALTALGAWDALAPRVAQADNVRAALALVARGEAPYGIVYATDAAATDDVTVVAEFPAASHPPIVYPAAVVAETADAAAAAEFIAFLASDAARPLFERQGFTVIE